MEEGLDAKTAKIDVSTFKRTCDFNLISSVELRIIAHYNAFLAKQKKTEKIQRKKRLKRRNASMDGNVPTRNASMNEYKFDDVFL